MTSKFIRVEREIAGQMLSIETGQVARQANGSVIVTYGGSKIFAAVTCGGARDDLDFFPLTVDYREKTEAAGKIPGGFFKREGRPTTKEVLTMRMIDRSIRPMFSDGFQQEIQVMTHALCYDEENNTDVLAMIGAYAALHISGMPFDATLGAMRVSMVDGAFIGLPTEEQRGDGSKLDLMVSGHKDGICMVESSANEITESEMIDALEFAQERILEVVSLIEELGEKAGKPEIDWSRPDTDDTLGEAMEAYSDQLRAAMDTQGKHERSAAMDVVKKACVDALTDGMTDDKELYQRTKAVKKAFRDLVGSTERAIILGGSRIDGRAWDEIREITIVPDFIPRQHGSVLFTRGETQALVSTTLGTPDDEQIIDGIEKEYRKHFYLHYNFPPYSVGETRRILGPGRREIGHGMLAERALMPVLPPKDNFPYTIRVVSDITESNGSSSMASVCGGCLSMMLAGVPLSQPIAGIAMGLVQEGDKTAILSDILGSEDHHGDMDFKVAGSGLGITALQMDIKIKGVSRELLEKALGQAGEGRRHILKKMLDVVSQPREETSEYAPKMSTVMIPSEKIGFLIGPGGKNIKAMQAEYECRISIVDDSGRVQIYGNNAAKVHACEDAIKGMCETPEVGSRYTGTVKAIKDFGAFIEILPGVEGLCHISELAEGYVERVDEIVKTGDVIEVKVIAVDDRGKVKLSHKAVLQEA
jgi:polyribonucleotide nucleotidyltransferase